MKKIVSILLSLVLCLGMLPVQAFAVSDLAEGGIRNTLSDGETMTNNHGTVKINRGTITNNYGTVEKNYGVINNNYGTVSRNELRGYISTNSGSVPVNAVGGEISTNAANGTVGENSGKIFSNDGTVNNNSPTDGVQDQSRGYIRENSGTGTVGSNMGRVQLNHGKINRNMFQADPFDKVDVNYGTIETNDGTVGDNNTGTIKDNSSLAEVEASRGTIERNAGTVKSNSGTVQQNSSSGKVYNIERGKVVNNSQGKVYWVTSHNTAANVNYSSFEKDNYIQNNFTISPAEGYCLKFNSGTNATFTLVNGAYKVTGITAAPVKWNVTAVPAVAEVEKEGDVTNVGDLQKALALTTNNGATVRLLQNVELEKTLSIEISCTLLWPRSPSPQAPGTVPEARLCPPAREFLTGALR